MPEKEQAQAFWQSREWWRKNGLKVIGTLITLAILIVGALITFNKHTEDIADLEDNFADMAEENKTLKDLIVDMNTDILQFEMTLKDLIEDMGELNDGVDRIEGILMGREE